MAELQKLQDYMNLMGMGTIHNTITTDYPALIKRIMYQFKPFAEFVRLQRLSMKQVVNMSYNLLYIYYNYVPRLVPEAMFAQVEHDAVVQQKIKITLLIMKIFVWFNVKNAKLSKHMRNNFYVFLPDKYKFQDFDFYLVTNCMADKDDRFFAQQKYIKEQKQKIQYKAFNISDEYPSPNDDYISQYKTLVLNLQPTEMKSQHQAQKQSRQDDDLNASALMINRENVERSRSNKRRHKMKKAKENSDDMEESMTNHIKQIQITKKQINNQQNKYWADQKQKQEQEIKDYEKFRQQLLADDVLVGELKQKINPTSQATQKQMTYQDLLSHNNSLVNQSQQLQPLSDQRLQSPQQSSLTQNRNADNNQVTVQQQPIQYQSVSLQTSSPIIHEKQLTQEQREQQLYEQLVPQSVQVQPVSILKNPVKQQPNAQAIVQNTQQIQPQVHPVPEQQMVSTAVQNSQLNHQILHQFNNNTDVPQNVQDSSNLSFSNSYVSNSIQQLPQVSQVISTPQNYQNAQPIIIQPQQQYQHEQYVPKQHVSKQQAEYLFQKYVNNNVSTANEIQLYQVSPLQQNKSLSESITDQYNQISNSMKYKSPAVIINKGSNQPKLMFDQEVLCEAIKLVQEEQEQKLKATIQKLQLEQTEKDRMYQEGIERLNAQIEEQRKRMSTMESEYQLKQQLIIDTNKQQLDQKETQLQQQQELLQIKTQQLQAQEQKIQNFELEKGQLETQQTILQRQLHEMLQKQQQEALQMQQQQQEIILQQQQKYMQQQQFQQQLTEQQLQQIEQRRKQQIQELEQQVMNYGQQVQQQLQSSQSVQLQSQPTYHYYSINMQMPQQSVQEPADTTQLQSECPQTLQASVMQSVSAIDESGSYATMDFNVEQDELLERKNKEKVIKKNEKLRFYKNISIEDDKIQQIGEILMKETDENSSSDDEPVSQNQKQRETKVKQPSEDAQGAQKKPKKAKQLEESGNNIQLNLTQTNVNDRFNFINSEYEKTVKKKLPPIQIKHSNRSMEEGERIMREVELRRSRLTSSFDDAYDQLKVTKGIDTGTSPVKSSDQGSVDTIGSASTVYNITDSFSEGKFKKGFMKQFISSQLSMSPDFTMHVVGEKVNKIDGKKYKQVVLESK